MNMKTPTKKSSISHKRSALLVALGKLGAPADEFVHQKKKVQNRSIFSNHAKSRQIQLPPTNTSVNSKKSVSHQNELSLKNISGNTGKIIHDKLKPKTPLLSLTNQDSYQQCQKGKASTKRDLLNGDLEDQSEPTAKRRLFDESHYPHKCDGSIVKKNLKALGGESNNSVGRLNSNISRDQHHKPASISKRRDAPLAALNEPERGLQLNTQSSSGEHVSNETTQKNAYVFEWIEKQFSPTAPKVQDAVLQENGVSDAFLSQALIMSSPFKEAQNSTSPTHATNAAENGEELLFDDWLPVENMPMQMAADEGLNNLPVIVTPSREDLQVDFTVGASTNTEQPPSVENLIEITDQNNQAIPEAVLLEPSANARKRSKNISAWKAIKAKAAYNTGKEHLNIKGQFIRARKLGPGCGADCRFKCHTKITTAEREKIFQHFWDLGDHVRQWDAIKASTPLKIPKRSKKTPSIETDDKKKRISRDFFLEVDGEKRSVCQKMFLSTLDVSESWLKTATQKNTRSGSTISPDKRGKHSKVNKADAQKYFESIVEHIKLFPVVPSHFCRLRSKRKYLESGLSISKMHKKYIAWMEKEAKEGRSRGKVASERRYHDVFCTNFNYGFHMPKKDQCGQCCQYFQSSEKRKIQLKPAYKLHKKNAKVAREYKDADKAFAKTDPSVCFALFDLQKVLATPRAETGDLFYKRRYNVFNLTVYNCVRHEAFCYMWTEAEAKRGANEIASCVGDFIEMMVKEHSVKEFRFWSDNCGGQNKNKYLFSMYTLMSARHNIKIIHRYLERGHTQNEGDSVHAIIERAAKSKQIFTPEQWYQVIKEAKQEGKPYTVKEMGGKVLDFHHLTDDYQQWSGHSQAKWKHLREISVDPNLPEKIQLKHSLDQEPAVEINVQRHSRGRPVNLKTFQPKTAYGRPLKLATPKLQDLAQLCNDGVIPTSYVGPYVSLVGIKPYLSDVLKAAANAIDHDDTLTWDNIENEQDWLWNEGEEDDETDYEEDDEAVDG